MLLLLALALQDPLGAEDIEARETAAQDLVRGGDLDTLRARLAAATDPEIRARLKGVVERLKTDLRRRGFGGGNEVGGLRARLQRIENPPDHRVPFQLEIMNVGAAATSFVPPRVWNAGLPGLSRSRSSAQGRIELKRLDDPPRGSFRGSYACGGGPDRRSVLLRPGESRTFDLLPDDRLEAGRYELRVGYFAKKLLDADEDLASDVATFEIKD